MDSSVLAPGSILNEIFHRGAVMISLEVADRSEELGLCRTPSGESRDSNRAAPSGRPGAPGRPPPRLCSVSRGRSDSVYSTWQRLPGSGQVSQGIVRFGDETT